MSCRIELLVSSGGCLPGSCMEVRAFLSAGSAVCKPWVPLTRRCGGTLAVLHGAASGVVYSSHAFLPDSWRGAARVSTPAWLEVASGGPEPSQYDGGGELARVLFTVLVRLCSGQCACSLDALQCVWRCRRLAWHPAAWRTKAWRFQRTQTWCPLCKTKRRDKHEIGRA